MNSPAIPKGVWSRGGALALLPLAFNGMPGVQVFVSCLLLATVSGANAGDPPATQEKIDKPLLTNAQQVLNLTPEQARLGLPVRIRGVVTCYDPGRVLFVQDETAGVFVYHTGETLPLIKGQGVQVTGVANSGIYSPFVDSPIVTRIETAPAISSKRVSLAQVFLGYLDAQYVELSGVVSAWDIADDRLKLELSDPPYRLTVWIPNRKGYEEMPLLDSQVQVRGVVGLSVADRNRVSGFQLFANDLSDLTILRPSSPDIFASPSFTVGQLASHYARRAAPGLVRVRGVVTLRWKSRELFLQDATGGLEVRARTLPEELPPGTLVEAVGHLGPILQSPRLEDAVVRKLATEPPPQPFRLLSEDLFRGVHQGELVEIEARFLGLAGPRSNRFVLSLQEGNGFLSAIIPGTVPDSSLAGMEPGSRLRLTGIIRPEEIPAAQSGAALLLRSPADVKVIGLPPQGLRTADRSLMTASILAGVCLAVALFFLQKQRRATTRLLRLQETLQSEMNQGEQQLRRSMEERERMARDLHDDIIQSIYAIGLNLEDCRRVARQSPERTDERLAAAIHTLNTTIRSVRGFIAGLEPKVLNGREFKTALKSLALTSGDSSIQFQIEVDPAAANRLTSAQATQLLHIAKEGMSNCLRHAHASLVSVSLNSLGSGARLEIQDDGSGFDPQAPAKHGHGLRNMSARAREIGAELQILSAPSQGCRILVNLATSKLE